MEHRSLREDALQAGIVSRGGFIDDTTLIEMGAWPVVGHRFLTAPDASSFGMPQFIRIELTAVHRFGIECWLSPKVNLWIADNATTGS